MIIEFTRKYEENITIIIKRLLLEMCG